MASSRKKSRQKNRKLSTPITQSSPLLSLPGEIRNQIYALVLSTGPRHTIDCTRGSKDRHINQLQHVCRQLHRETRLLEIKFNPVEIAGFAMHTHYKLLDDKDLMKASTVFLRLTRALGSPRLSWIQSLTLSNRVPGVDSMWHELEEMASTILHLTEVFGRNPALRVRYNITTFCKANILREGIGVGLGLGVIFHGIFVSSVIRNEPLKDMWLTDVWPNVDGRQMMRRARTVDVFQALMQAPLQTKQLWLERIRFFPNPDIVTAQSLFLRPASSLRLRQAKAQGLFPLWRALVKRWLKEGI